MEVKKPSERIIESIFDGKEIKDKLGRVLRLRKPNIIDRYNLTKALGTDADNPSCMSMMIPIIHVAGIDGQVVETPRSYSECIAALKRLGDEGIAALGNYIESAMSTEDEDTEKVKK